MIRKMSADILDELEIRDIDVDAKVSGVPLAQRQLVEIAKALSHDLKVLILDEPTAPLTNEDTAHLFEILKHIRSRGVSIIFITHRLKEVLTYCDRGTILRNGKTVESVRISDIDESSLIELMIGQKAEGFYRASDASGAAGKGSEAILKVEHLSIGDKVHDIGFQLHRGEIVGVTGLLGAGQNEMARSLFGIQDGASVLIELKGRRIRIRSPKEAVENGICLLTENRKEEGLVLGMSVKENITLPSLRRFNRSRLFPFIHNGNERRAAQNFIDKVNIVVRSPNSKIRTLSGGNQQKSIVARWLLRSLEILIFIEPTRGIDVGAKAEIYRLLISLASEGKSIMVVSTDHNEILGISDRIFVMYKGRLSSIIPHAEANEEVLLSAIQGWSTDAQSE
jgi:ribose transport system ATP-binding protein